MDRWMICDAGHVHWGTEGAAGLLLRFIAKNGTTCYLLQQRSGWVDYPGTWGIPGGAIRRGESPEAAASREAVEEIGPIRNHRITGIDAQDCGGGWKFYTVCADADSAFPAFCVQETDATGWFTREQMLTLKLHPGLREWFEEHD